jgi:hypothetical protein
MMKIGKDTILTIAVLIGVTVLTYNLLYGIGAAFGFAKAWDMTHKEESEVAEFKDEKAE